jgi:hypothetical protein
MGGNHPLQLDRLLAATGSAAYFCKSLIDQDDVIVYTF